MASVLTPNWIVAACHRMSASETLYAKKVQLTQDEIDDQLDEEARAAGFKHKAENPFQVRRRANWFKVLTVFWRRGVMRLDLVSWCPAGDFHCAGRAGE